MKKNKKFKIKKIIMSICLAFVLLFSFMPFVNVSNHPVNAMNNTFDVFPDSLNYQWRLEDVTNGFTPATGLFVDPGFWTVEDNVFYSSDSTQYQLSDNGVNGYTWQTREWYFVIDGVPTVRELDGYNVWTNGIDVFYSSIIDNLYCVLDLSSYQWNPKEWFGLTEFSGSDVFKVGNDYYILKSGVTYIIDFSTSTISDAGFSFPSNVPESSLLSGKYVWTDGVNVFLSVVSGSVFVTLPYNYILDVQNNTWQELTFNFNINGNNVWSDGINVFYDNGSEHYKYDKVNRSWSVNTWNINDNFNEYNLFRYNGFYFLQINSSALYSIPLGYYSAGYSAGYNAGYLAGLDPSLEDAYNDGYNAGYDSGYIDGASANDGYSAGYNAGYNRGYDAGKNAGYDNGYLIGKDEGYNSGYSAGESAGYDSGYSAGVDVGYHNGFNDGVNESNDYSFFNLFGAVIDAPVKVFTSLFNFNLLGVNLFGLITSLFTLAFVLWIIKLVLGGK